LTPFFVWLALEQNVSQQLPIQFHTGFGDKDADLRQANPLHLRTVIEHWHVPIVLLHAGWPYYRETAHLAALCGHVWLDLSLAIPFATIGIPAMLRQVLGMAPWSKVLFATDAFTMPEIYWLAAKWGRWGLAQVLTEMETADFITNNEAYQAAEMILKGTARQLYNV
jgi:predicted TIM-barrel fold metal-dependent hydrolase